MKYIPLIAVVCAAILGGCATGPDFKTYSSTLNPPKEGEARVWFYRPSKMMGGLVQPMVIMDDRVVGKAQPGCFFYADRKPGTYTLQCVTEWTDKSQLTVNANQVYYVRMSLLPGVMMGHILPKEVDEKKGLKEIANCHLITADGQNQDWKPPAKGSLPDEKKQ